MATIKRLVFFLLASLLLAAAGAEGSGALAARRIATSPAPAIRLKAAFFRPAAGEIPRLPVQLQAAPAGSGQPAEWLVQFRGPVLAEWRVTLVRLRVEILDYIPDDAFRIRTTPENLAAVRRLEPVIWVGPYHPAYKLSPQVHGGGRLVVRLGSPAGASAIVVEVERQGGSVERMEGAALTILLPPGGEIALARRPEVDWIEPAPDYRYFNNIARLGGGGLDAYALWDLGVFGAGQIVGLADSGLDTNNLSTLHLDFRGRVIAISKRSCFPLNPPLQTDTAGHGTHTAGSILGNGAASGTDPSGHDYGQFSGADPNLITGKVTGIAPEARLYFQATGCQNGADLPEDLEELFAPAYASGARIHSDSWGTPADGVYRSGSHDVDYFTWNHPDMLIVLAAGNYGADGDNDGWVDPDSLAAPATAKNALSVGASENARANGGENLEDLGNDLDEQQCSDGGVGATYHNCAPASFDAAPTGTDLIGGLDNWGQLWAGSSRGPADDGRLKPDLVAPGANILSTRSSSDAQTSAIGGPLTSLYAIQSGTSMAAPLAAGSAALVRDWYARIKNHANPSAALIKATLIITAVDLPGYGDTTHEAGLPIPNVHEGWGFINLANVAFDGRAFFDGESLETGELARRSFSVTGSEPLKVTLVWSDYPAAISAAKTLVNDLDLLVSGPGGQVYRGNVFAGGWSQTGGTTDAANNVENVYLQTPAPGNWIVEVHGANIPYGPQPFALVVSGGADTGEPTPEPVDEPPVVAISVPQAGQTVSGLFEVQVKASDDYSLVKVTLSLDGGPPLDLTGNDNGSDFSYPWDTRQAANGTHTLQARAEDDAGQATESQVVTASVQNTFPPSEPTATPPAVRREVSWLPLVLFNKENTP